MTNLITAFQIFSKYTEDQYCLGAEHDEIYIYVDPETVSPEDITRLEQLSFHADGQRSCFYHFV